VAPTQSCALFLILSDSHRPAAVPNAVFRTPARRYLEQLTRSTRRLLVSNHCTVNVRLAEACADCVCGVGLGCFIPEFP